MAQQDQRYLCSNEDADSIPGQHNGLKDPALPQLQLESDLCPRNSICCRAAKKEKKKKKKKGRKEILICTKTWLNLEDIMLSEITQ